MASHVFRWIGALLLGTTAPGAHAQIQLLQQTRRVEVSAEQKAPPEPFDVSDSENAPDFTPWVAAANVAPPLTTGSAEALASQNSSASTATLQAVGSIRAQGSALTGAHMATRSLYRVQFAVTEPTNYAISGLLARSTRTPLLSVTLDRVAGPRVFESTLATLELEKPLGGAGPLAPAVYELTVSVSLDLDVFSEAEFVREAAFVMQFDVGPGTASPSDLDGDGDVDLADFQVMQNSFTGPEAE